MGSPGDKFGDYRDVQESLSRILKDLFSMS